MTVCHCRPAQWVSKAPVSNVASPRASGIAQVTPTLGASRSSPKSSSTRATPAAPSVNMTTPASPAKARKSLRQNSAEPDSWP